MMKRIPALLLALGIPFLATAETIEWPGGARVAVSLSYDDALDSQLDMAVPALDAHGFKASFYLVMWAPTITQRLDD